MRFDREPWRRLYRSEPLDQRRWPVLTRGIRDLLLRMPDDDDGVLLHWTTDPVTDLVNALGPHPAEREAVAESIRTLLADGYLELTGGGTLSPAGGTRGGHLSPPLQGQAGDNGGDNGGTLQIRNFAEAQRPISKAAAKKRRQRSRQAPNTPGDKGGQRGDNPGDKKGDISREQNRSRRDQKIPPKPPGGPVLTNPEPGPPKPPDRAEQVREVFAAWQATGHERAKLDDKRKRLISARLKDGYSVADLKQAVAGCAASDWHQGQNDRKQKYNDISLICRDAAHVDRFRELAERASSPAPVSRRAEQAQRALADARRRADKSAPSQPPLRIVGGSDG